MPGIFLSYRRSDSGGWTGRLRDHLVVRYGEDQVWQDVDDLTAGSEYLPQILKSIARADAVLVVIGPHWLSERLADPRDVLRIEIVHALKRKSGVIPTLVGGAKMPDATDLPRPIAPLVKRHGITMDDGDWSRSVQTLFQKLQELSRSARAGRKRPIPSLADVLATLDRLQTQYFEQLDADPQAAALTSREALRVLDEQTPIYPHDQTLQLFRGFFLKNLAMAERDAGDMTGFESHLALADRIFSVVQREAELHLANAYTGSASVPMLRGDGEKALALINSALALVPDHIYARYDREQIRRFFKL